MNQNRNGILNIELDCIQLEKIKHLLDPSQPIFQIKLFFTSENHFENIMTEIKANNIKINSIESNFKKIDNMKKIDNNKSNILDQNISVNEDFFLNLSKEMENDESNAKMNENINQDLEIDEEEKKEVFHQEQSDNAFEKHIEKIDEIKLIYLQTNNKHDEIIEEYQDEDPDLEISFSSTTSITIKGNKKTVLKAERNMRRLIINLVFQVFKKQFNSEEKLENYINSEYVQEIIEEYGLKFMQMNIANYPHLKNKFPDISLIFFVEDKEGNNNLNQAINKMLNHRSFKINLNEYWDQNLTPYDKTYKKKINKMKLEFIKTFLQKDLQEKAQALDLKIVDITVENNINYLTIEGDDDSMNLYKIDLKMYFFNLRSIVKTNEGYMRKNFYFNEVSKNLDNFEINVLSKENSKFGYPLMFSQKYDENEQFVLIILLGIVDNLKIDYFNNIGVLIQRILDYQEKVINIKSPYLRKKIKNADYLKNLQVQFELKITIDQKSLKIIGNIENIKEFENYLKEQEKEAIREKSIYYFNDFLVFLIFRKYQFKDITDNLKKILLIIENPSCRNETKSFEFMHHPDHKDKIIEYLDQISDQIKSKIETKIIEYSGKSKYKLLTNPDFQKKLINSDSQKESDILAVEMITNQQKIKNMRKITDANTPSNQLSINFMYKDLIEIHLYDSKFLEDIELKGLIVNIDVKGVYLDRHSEKIAKTSETDRFVAKELNKLNDNSMNKKKRAEVSPIVECRNASKSYKVNKMFISIIRNKKSINNANMNQEIYSFALDYKTKQIYKDHSKFTYPKNLEAISRTCLDDKLESLGIIVPDNNEIDSILDFIKSFCNKNADFSSLKNIHIFTNNNNETTELNNRFREFLIPKNAENLNKFNNNNNSTMEKTSILTKQPKKSKYFWKFLNNNNREEDFTQTENQNINLAFAKKIQEIYFIKRVKQTENTTEIFLNLKENKATDLQQYKQINFYGYLDQNQLLKKLVQNYKQIGISSVTFYEDNSEFLRLDLEKMTVEKFSSSYFTFRLLKEESIEEEPAFYEDGDNQISSKLYCGVSGYQIDVDEAILRINAEFDIEKKEDEYIFPKNLEASIIEEIYENLKNKNNEVILHLDNNKLKIKGLLQDVNEIKSLFIDEVCKTLHKLEIVQFPKEWIDQKDYYFSVKLSNKDEEYKKVAILFLKSLQNTKIVKITRIQNTRLYSLYAKTRSHITEYKNVVNESYLFHGTSTTDPKDIYKGIDVGFDMRMAKDGLWGKAIYFAENANYVDPGFAFTTKSDKKVVKKMILAQVILGESKSMPTDQSLRRPPIKDEKTKELYDSVEGIAQNSKLHMIYDNNRAYPAYLITYV